ncbi:hypothetical protein K449DRAFT_65430 [Hypoxylon sp. EC38]|nr:hypothetical protein K449DRAFT_65430 [Hypoxylon sp. EC38]
MGSLIVVRPNAGCAVHGDAIPIVSAVGISTVDIFIISHLHHEYLLQLVMQVIRRLHSRDHCFTPLRLTERCSRNGNWWGNVKIALR